MIDIYNTTFEISLRILIIMNTTKKTDYRKNYSIRFYSNIRKRFWRFRTQFTWRQQI